MRSKHINNIVNTGVRFVRRSVIEHVYAIPNPQPSFLSGASWGYGKDFIGGVGGISKSFHRPEQGCSRQNDE